MGESRQKMGRGGCEEVKGGTRRLYSEKPPESHSQKGARYDGD